MKKQDWWGGTPPQAPCFNWYPTKWESFCGVG
jgi:hypothetical protein